jgi:phosphatidate cytidylyltransferase
MVTRIVTAVVLALIVIPAIAFGGGIGVAVLVAVFTAAGLWELSTSLNDLKSGLGKWITPALGVLVVTAFWALPYAQVFSVVVFLPLVVLVLHLLLYHVIDNTVESASGMIFALSYVAIPLSHAVLLRRLDNGAAWILLVLFTVCLGDVGAYFTGKYFGKHRITPNVSPGKTAEGLVGVLIGSFAGVSIVKLAFPSLPDFFRVLVPLALLLAVVGPLGDMVASAVKRKVGIKDYGSIFPGHGGVMDRADSLIPAIPVAFHYLVFCGITVLK